MSDGVLTVTLVVRLPSSSSPIDVLESKLTAREFTMVSVAGVDQAFAKQVLGLVQTFNPGLEFKAVWVGPTEVV